MLEVAAKQKIFVAKLTAHMSLNKEFKINVMPKVMGQQQKKKTTLQLYGSFYPSFSYITNHKTEPWWIYYFPLYFPNPWP